MNLIKMELRAIRLSCCHPAPLRLPYASAAGGSSSAWGRLLGRSEINSDPERVNRDIILISSRLIILRQLPLIARTSSAGTSSPTATHRHRRGLTNEDDGFEIEWGL